MKCDNSRGLVAGHGKHYQAESCSYLQFRAVGTFQLGQDKHREAM